jgi:hypothetical protein
VGARGAAALVALALVLAGTALGTALWTRDGDEPATEPAPPPRPEPPAREPEPEPEPVSVPGVTVAPTEDGLVAANDHGEWTILTRCASGGGETVGPAYVSRLVAPDGEVLVDDRGPPQPLNDPGYGGLGAFAWHHARGRPGELRLGRDNAWEVSGRICAEDAGGFGVSAARLLAAPAAGADDAGDPYVSFAVEVELSDEWTYPEPLMRVRYRYRVHREAVRAWIAVTELCPGGRCGSTSRRAFLKEPKLAAGTRAGAPLPYSRAAILDGEGALRCIFVGGGPPEGPVLHTGQCGHPGRARARFDTGTAASGADGACDRVPCLHVTMRGHAAADGDVEPGGTGAAWHGAPSGFDGWAVDASARPQALDRDTGSIDGVVWDCHGGDPAGEGVRRWETIARLDEAGRHLALAVLFTAWQGGRGGYDCEPLLRLFGPEGATWGAYAEYALGP